MGRREEWGGGGTGVTSVFSTFPIWKILENTMMFYKRKFWETIKSNFPNFSYILENSLFHFS